MVKLTAKFSFMERHNLTQVVIEGIANILGDTTKGLTVIRNTQISFVIKHRRC